MVSEKVGILNGTKMARKKKRLNRKNGERDGLEIRWYKNGQKASERHHKEGKLISASVWKPDGEPCTETNIVDGSGVVVVYLENGEKKYEEHWKNGTL